MDRRANQEIFAKEPRDHAVDELIEALRENKILPEDTPDSNYLLAHYEALSSFPHPLYDVRPLILKSPTKEQLELMLDTAQLVASARELDVLIHPNIAHSYTIPFKVLNTPTKVRLIRDMDWPQAIGFWAPRIS